MKKILTVLGARPQFIKASIVSERIASVGNLVEVVVHTGQHFDANMSTLFFEELGMAAPAHSLGIHGGSHGEMTGRMLIALDKVMIAERPDAVLVYGDTNSTLAGALCSAKLHLPIAHVEAGLRSFNLRMPEEINRIVTDRLSRWLFTPTAQAEQHLRNEGVAAERIVPVGDVMYDVALRQASRVAPTGRVLGALGLQPGSYALFTVHRAENTDDPERMAVIVGALGALASSMPIVWPLHPRTRAVLQCAGHLDRLCAAVHIIDPVGYLDMVQLERFAAVIATDSGGVQKEAFFYKVPCITLREETEWVELVHAGWNRVVPPVDPTALRAAVLAAVGTSGSEVAPYGTGDAALRIVERLKVDLGGSS
jgi:UDP-GlcNAc3NAcA epimerase